jgi:hypothetical protein
MMTPLASVSRLSSDPVSRFRLPIRPGSAISANFIARLIKGCRVDVRAGCLIRK